MNKNNVNIEVDKIKNIDLQEAKEEIKKLYEKAEYNARLYYEEDKTEISDYEYDIIIHKLKYLEEKFPKLKKKNTITERIGGIPNSSFEKVNHEVSMQSLQDVFSFDEVLGFDEKVRKALNKDEVEYVVETKIDGLSATLKYMNGRLVLGATRGNGQVGENVTNNMRVVKNVPTKIDYKGEFIVRRRSFYV